MRTIKFRGQTLLQNDIILFGKSRVGQLAENVMIDNKIYPTAIVTNGIVIPVLPETVSEFTGLTDKNSVEIYENDIIRKHNYRNGEYIEDYIVVFDYGSYCLKTIRDNEIHPKLTLISFGNFDDNGNLRKEYIIGNIFDNPELL